MTCNTLMCAWELNPTHSIHMNLISYHCTFKNDAGRPFHFCIYYMFLFVFVFIFAGQWDHKLYTISLQTAAVIDGHSPNAIIVPRLCTHRMGGVFRYSDRGPEGPETVLDQLNVCLASEECRIYFFKHDDDKIYIIRGTIVTCINISRLPCFMQSQNMLL